MSHANGARRRSGARASVSGSSTFAKATVDTAEALRGGVPRGEAPRTILEPQPQAQPHDPPNREALRAAHCVGAEHRGGAVRGLAVDQKIGQVHESVGPQADGELRVKVELGNLPKGSRAEVSGTPNVKSTVERGSTGWMLDQPQLQTVP